VKKKVILVALFSTKIFKGQVLKKKAKSLIQFLKTKAIM
jgi:hypothetical protein